MYMIFTDSALWAGSDIEPCPSVTKDVIVDFCQMVRVFDIFHRVGVYGSEDSKFRRRSKLHDQFKSYNDFNDNIHP